MDRVDYLLRILMGDRIFDHLPIDIDEFVAKQGSEKKASEMSPLEKLSLIMGPFMRSWTETVVETLILLFEQRFGWKAEDTRKLAMPKLLEALKHAMEHDDPQKPSVWKMVDPPTTET
jgi:hypothetical protein